MERGTKDTQKETMMWVHVSVPQNVNNKKKKQNCLGYPFSVFEWLKTFVYPYTLTATSFISFFVLYRWFTHAQMCKRYPFSI